MITSEEFDKMICGADYSKEKDKSVWVVIPTKPLPENGDMDVFLERFRQSWLELPGIPIYAVCYSGLELNEKGNICCPHCKWEIIVEGE